MSETGAPQAVHTPDGVLRSGFFSFGPASHSVGRFHAQMTISAASTASQSPTKSIRMVPKKRLAQS